MNILMSGLRMALPIGEMLIRMSARFHSRIEQSIFKATYIESQQDIFIASYPKSGTTWMQMIIYQLLTDGDMSISHISTFSPHLEIEISRHSISGELPRPGVFKTHLTYNLMPKGCGKYIYMVRDGRDVAASYYFHHVRYYNYSSSMDEFCNLFIRGRLGGSWFNHVSEWLKNRQKLNLLVVKYEDLVNNFPDEIKRIADFCEVNVLPGDLPRIMHRCSLGYMRNHEAVFDLDFYIGLAPPTSRPNFIRSGAVGEGAECIKGKQLANFIYKCRRKSIPYDFGG